MQTLTIQITDNTALQTLYALEEKHLIKIVEENEIDSPVLPGEPLTWKAFKSWIAASEKVPAISLNDLQARWQNKRKQLQKLTK